MFYGRYICFVMKTILSTDQLNRKVEISFPPVRIVSLVPSQTELLFDLGLSERIAGITRFCIHPDDKVKSIKKIGGTKQFNTEAIKQLKPDLIIGNKEENYEEGIEELRKYFPVWMSDIYSLPDALNMISEVGRITDTTSRAQKLIQEINLPPVTHTGTRSVAYFIWRKPYMVAAGNTFINDMLHRFGITNVFGTLQRYPEINPSELAELKPDFIFLSSEPYSFRRQHLAEFEAFCHGSKAVLVDGEMFSWYGSRLRLAPAYFTQLNQQLSN